jgi:cytochrome P450
MVTQERSGKVWTYPFGPPDGLRLDPTYAHLREHEPLARVQLPAGREAWLVTRYADVRAVYADARFSRVVREDEPRVQPPAIGDSLFSMDPPAHTRLRALVAKAFHTRRVERLRARVEELAEQLVDGMLAAGPPVDLVEHLALPLPVTIMCELLGVPVEDRHRFARWAGATVAAGSLSAGQIQLYLGRLAIYMGRLIARRREEPTDDLLTDLVHARDEGDRLSEEELLQLAVTLLTIGFETTATQIPNFVYLLLTHPAHRERLWAEPGLLPAAVEELLRYTPIASFAMFPRYATEEVELSGGVVAVGEPVLVVSAAANRDPRVFADPERLDLTREPNPHLALGHGIHHCLGGPLARVELRTTLATLIRRMPGLRLAVGEDGITWKKGQLVRGPAVLPVTW